MSEPPRPKLPRLQQDSGVTCKGCGEIHWFEGYGEGCNAPIRHGEEKDEIFCVSKKKWFAYDLMKEAVYRNFSPMAFASNETVLSRMNNIEERLAKLELKTAELPEKDGIKQLKSEIGKDFTGFLADTLKKTDSGATYG